MYCRSKCDLSEVSLTDHRGSNITMLNIPTMKTSRPTFVRMFFRLTFAFFQARGESSNSLWFGKGGWVSDVTFYNLAFFSWHYVEIRQCFNHENPLGRFNYPPWLWKLAITLERRLGLAAVCLGILSSLFVLFQGHLSYWPVANVYWTALGCPDLAAGHL